MIIDPTKMIQALGQTDHTSAVTKELLETFDISLSDLIELRDLAQTTGKIHLVNSLTEMILVLEKLIYSSDKQLSLFKD